MSGKRHAISRLRVVLFATAAATVGLATAGASGAIDSTRGGGAVAWISHDVSAGAPTASASALTSSGKKLVVTGRSWGETTGYDFGTVALETGSGAKLWTTRYNGPGNGDDAASSLVLSQDGREVFVTGSSPGLSTGFDYATVAYDAMTGAKLWTARYNGPGNADDRAWSLVLSPDGGKVFVTGSSIGSASGGDYATVAYSAATGATLWTARYNGPANGEDGAISIAVSPYGTVFVTGSSEGVTTGDDYATVAYDAASGTQLWASRYDGGGYPWPDDGASSIAVGADGQRVFVTGTSAGMLMNWSDYATVAYDAASGTRLWTERYDGGLSTDYASALAVRADGTVFVTGASWLGGSSFYMYATVAYNGTTGSKEWAAHAFGYKGQASSLALSADGSKLIVTGTADFVNRGTVAYNANSGAELWWARYRAGGAVSVVLGPAALKGRAFVTGSTSTVAYSVE